MSDAISPEDASQPLDRDVSLVTRATEEFLRQLDCGVAVDVATFAANYPTIEALLCSVLPALQLVGSASTAGAYFGNLPGVSSNDSGRAADHCVDQGVVLGDYKLLREIGRGGMGVVYEADQFKLSRRVALKVLPFAATLDPRQIKRFQNESQIVAGLDHPNIVEVHAVGCEQQVHFFTMRLVKGLSLAETIEQLAMEAKLPTQATASTTTVDTADVSTKNTPTTRTLPISVRSTLAAKHHARYRNIVAMMVQIADALAHAHQHGVIHRDVKPGNILIDSQGKPWITDFGLAQVSSAESLTLTGDIVGTLKYLAPELLNSPRKVDHRVDIYGWGATCYELLALRPLIVGKDQPSMLHQLRSGEQVRLSKHDDKIPRELETIIMKAVEHDPTSRYNSATELLGDLKAWLDGRPISIRPIGTVGLSWRWCKRNPWVAGLTATICFLSVMVTLVTSFAGWRISQQNVQLKLQRDSLISERAKALQVIESMTSSSALEFLQDRPLLTTEQNEFLSNAVKLYTSYLDGFGSSDIERVRRVNVYLQMGSTLSALGRGQEAQDAFQNSVNDCTLLLEEKADPQLLMLAAKSEHLLGREFSLKGSQDEAIDAVRSAIEKLQAISETNQVSAEEKQPRLAYAKETLGIAFRRTGDWENSQQQLIEAIQIWKALSADEPDAQWIARQATCNETLGNIAKELSNFEQAISYHTEAIELLNQPRLASKLSRDKKSALAGSYSSLGNALRHQDRFQDSEASHQRALQLLEELTASFPGVEAYQSSLTSSLNNLSLVKMQTQQFKEARQLLETVVARRRHQVASNPNNLSGLQGLVGALSNTGKVYELSGDYASAVLWFQQADATAQEFLERIASDDTLRLYQRNANWALAATLDALGKSTESIEAWNKAKSLDTRGFLDFDSGIALCYARQGDLQQAMQEAVRLLATNTSDREVLFDIARIYALKYASSLNDAAKPSPPENEVNDSVVDYAELAVNMLRRSIDSGFSQHRLAHDEPAFEPIRSRPDFQQELVRLSKE